MGSRPVSSTRCGKACGAALKAPAAASVETRLKWARIWLAPWFRPHHKARSVCTPHLRTGVSQWARKCAIERPTSVLCRGRRSNTRACDVARHWALTKRLENTGWASSPRASASVTSKADIRSSSTSRSLPLCRSIWRNSTSSSGLTHTVVCARSSGQAASKHTRSA